MTKVECDLESRALDHKCEYVCREGTDLMEEPRIPESDDGDPGDSIRFSEMKNDEVVAQLIANFHVRNDEFREAFVESWSDDDIQEFDTYVFRRALIAWRNSSAHDAITALDGFHLFDEIKGSEWLSRLQFVLYVARLLGVDLSAQIDRAREFATDSVLRELALATEGLDRVDSLEQIGFAETHTSFGIGLISLADDLTSSESVWTRGSPKLGNRRVVFKPIANVPELAILVARELHDQRGFSSTSFGATNLASAWFGDLTTGPYVAVNGCLSFTLLDSDGDIPRFEVYVAEYADVDDEDDDNLEVDEPDDGLDEFDDENITGDALIVSRGSLVVVIGMIPDFDSDDEPDETQLESLEAVVETAFDHFEKIPATH